MRNCSECQRRTASAFVFHASWAFLIGLARTNKITPLFGTAPKRVAIIAFDNVDKAKAWYDTPAQKEINEITERALKARWFIVDGHGQLTSICNDATLTT